MPQIPRNLSAAQAAARLGVSAKALRLYEQHGLIAPDRTAAGWRAYGPADMARAAQIVALRTLGLSLAQVGRALAGDASALDAGLASHEGQLRGQARHIAEALARIGHLRAGIARGETPAIGDAIGARPRLNVAFDLPWPWGGERFELNDIGPLTFITGPLGSGKTRLAQALAAALPGARFVGLDRVAAETTPRTEQALTWLVEDGAERSDALAALLTALDDDATLVIDMVEQGLDQATQEALMRYVRLHRRGTLLLMTRSSSILDLEAAGADEAILLCPANHAPPIRVAPFPGTPGYEATAQCLGTPQVRARTAGVIAWRQPAAG
jgi:DNA-binding transcriptional MerR regulator